MNHSYHCRACNRVWPTEKPVGACPFCESVNIHEPNGMLEGGERNVVYKCSGFFNTDYRDSYIPGCPASRGNSPY